MPCRSQWHQINLPFKLLPLPKYGCPKHESIVSDSPGPRQIPGQIRGSHCGPALAFSVSVIPTARLTASPDFERLVPDSPSAGREFGDSSDGTIGQAREHRTQVVSDR
jgi:hypothetical protein